MFLEAKKRLIKRTRLSVGFFVPWMVRQEHSSLTFFSPRISVLYRGSRVLVLGKELCLSETEKSLFLTQLREFAYNRALSLSLS